MGQRNVTGSWCNLTNRDAALETSQLSQALKSAIAAGSEQSNLLQLPRSVVTAKAISFLFNEVSK